MPTGPFDEIQEPVRDVHHQAGWPGTVYSYTPAGSGTGEWYDDTGGGDEGWTSDGGVAVTIRVETSTAPSSERGPSGRVVEGDAVVIVDPTEHPGGKAAFTDGAGEDERATEVVDEASGQRYRALRVVDEHTGVLLLDSEELQ